MAAPLRGFLDSHGPAAHGNMTAQGFCYEVRGHLPIGVCRDDRALLHPRQPLSFYGSGIRFNNAFIRILKISTRTTVKTTADVKSVITSVTLISVPIGVVIQVPWTSPNQTSTVHATTMPIPFSAASVSGTSFEGAS